MLKDMFKNGQYNLLGLVDFWLEDLDFNRYGQVILSIDQNMVALAKDVFEMFDRYKLLILMFINLIDKYFLDFLSHSRKH